MIFLSFILRFCEKGTYCLVCSVSGKKNLEDVSVFLTSSPHVYRKLNELCSLCRVLVRRARKLAQQYFLVYQEPIPTGQLVQRVASVMQEYTQSGCVLTKTHEYGYASRHITFCVLKVGYIQP